jgi:hypothetical protein
MRERAFSEARRLAARPPKGVERPRALAGSGSYGGTPCWYRMSQRLSVGGLRTRNSTVSRSGRRVAVAQEPGGT